MDGLVAMFDAVDGVSATGEGLYPEATITGAKLVEIAKPSA